jgi:hypothetical protein
MEAVFRNVPLVDHIRISDFGIRLKFRYATIYSNNIFASSSSCQLVILISDQHTKKGANSRVSDWGKIQIL